MIKSTSQLFRSILLPSPMCKPETISKRIADLFNLKLISVQNLVKRHDYNDMAPVVVHELNKNSCKSWMLDGFPRTREEAEQLWAEQKCHVVINLKLPADQLAAQATKICYEHPESGRLYSMEFNPPMRPGRDDVTGEELVRCEDLTHEEIKCKILEDEDAMKPVLDFYRQQGILQEIRGNSKADLIHRSRICLSSLLPDAIL